MRKKKIFNLFKNLITTLIENQKEELPPVSIPTIPIKEPPVSIPTIPIKEPPKSKEEKMIKIDLLTDYDYHSQINNKFVPYEACNVTSAIMYLKANNVQYYIPKTIKEAQEKLKKWGVKNFVYPSDKIQDEDYLMTIIRSPASFEAMKIIAPWAVKQGIMPNEVHYMLEWAINELVGKKISKFVFPTMQDWVYELIIKKRAMIIAGKFTEYGHIVMLSGIKTKQLNIKSVEDVDLSQIECFIVEDPYGDYHTGYKNSSGSNIEFTVEELRDIAETRFDYKAKWTHMLI